MKSTILIILACGLMLVGCAKKEIPPTQESAQATKESSPPPQAQPSSGIPLVSGDTVTTASGLKYVEVVVGQGDTPKVGQIVKVHYTVWLTNGTRCESSRDGGVPLEFPAGVGKVIQGLDEGLSSMKAGGRRMMIIPPELAYKDRGTPGGPIPPGATLVFDIDLVSVANPPEKL